MKQSFDCSNVSFLIVDDNVHMRRIIRALLHSFGSRHILEAEDGAAGLEAFAIHSPQVVITDLRMPILDGIELTRMIRQGHARSNPDAPIIMCSGFSEQRIVMEATRAGVNDFLLKPISSKRLQQGIASVLAGPKKYAGTDSDTTAEKGDSPGLAPKLPPPVFFDDSIQVRTT